MQEIPWLHAFASKSLKVFRLFICKVIKKNSCTLHSRISMSRRKAEPSLACFTMRGLARARPICYYIADITSESTITYVTRQTAVPYAKICNNKPIYEMRWIQFRAIFTFIFKTNLIWCFIPIWSSRPKFWQDPGIPGIGLFLNNKK